MLYSPFKAVFFFLFEIKQPFNNLFELIFNLKRSKGSWIMEITGVTGKQTFSSNNVRNPKRETRNIYCNLLIDENAET